MKKRTILAMITAVVSIVLIGCSAPAEATTSADTTAAVSETEMLSLTREELKAYNGKDGMPAYVAVDGVIYDVSGSARWKDGEHNGYSAGQDLTDAILNVSPHGTRTLSRMPIVGELTD